ncbi:hypothetical protein BT93_L3309 [Corymbia citriodora subsp. variegata]|uniref:MYB transcription factor n=1 Tax=Corymbia citriodora subsp. variegata TaxID=360336 RepID=A0A8T0CY83_CORYI|nr:hypothetical protein BT93_L3309 [Corymbia citriodora subsp. variegata]
MGKGRAPCCDKNQVKRGPWSPAEDSRLISFIQKYGHENWRALPKQAGLLRCGKSCRLRWINYLRPDVKRGNFTKEEEDTILQLHHLLGNKWSKIASHLPGRTDNEIKNVWNTHLKKRLAGKGRDQSKHKSSVSSSSSSSSVSSLGSRACVERNARVDPERSTGQGPLDEKSCGQEGMVPPPLLNEALEAQEKLAKRMPDKKDSKDQSLTFSGSNEPDHLKGMEEQMDSFFSFSSPYDPRAALEPEEVNKPDKNNNELGNFTIDIPFECDVEFWNMLDSLEPFSVHKADVGQDGPRPGEGLSMEDEDLSWLWYLEDELGLEATKEGGGQDNSRTSSNATSPSDRAVPMKACCQG